MRHFWNWVRNEDDTRTLFLEGVIAEDICGRMGSLLLQHIVSHLLNVESRK